MPNFFNKYPYTDFHELNLDWILEIIKDLTAEWADTLTAWNETQQAWHDEQEAFQDLHDYVMNYFDNLDVQEEINNKLDEMASDGTLDQILLPYFNEYKTEINLLVSGYQDQIDALDARMSTFTQLAEGSTTGDAELMDIRDPAAGFHNNQPYDTAGDAVRGQILEVAANYGDLTSLIVRTTDLNGLTVRGIYMSYTFNDPANYPNMPYYYSGGTFVLNVYLYPALSTIYQVIIYANGMAYIRRNSSGTWTAWSMLSHNTFVLPRTADLNDTKTGIYLSLPITANTDYPNSPMQIINDTFTLENIVSGTSVAQTISYTSGSSFYRRYISGAWTSWKSLTLDNVYGDELISIFHTLGVIGDSMAAGYGRIDQNANSHDFYEYSWPACIARKYGNTVYNFSKSGLTTRSWLTDSMGYPLMSDGDHDAQGYIIALGVNDTQLGAAYLGTSADIDLDDYTQDADTFYGNYARIISLCRVQMPTSKIFVVTIPGTSAIVNDFNTAIRYMATIFQDVYVIELEPSIVSAPNFMSRNTVYSHFSPAGYVYIANYIAGKVSSIIYKDPSPFYFVNLTGTIWDGNLP